MEKISCPSCMISGKYYRDIDTDDSEDESDAFLNCLLLGEKEAKVPSGSDKILLKIRRKRE
jgi:hypothetical protein